MSMTTEGPEIQAASQPTGEGTVIVVSADDDGRRLDRVLRAAAPQASFGLIQKLARKGAIRLDGKRAKPDVRVGTGQRIKVSQALADLIGVASERNEGKAAKNTQFIQVAEQLRNRIICEIDYLVVFDKPAGLAVQGGSKTKVHVDGALVHFADDHQRVPKLVHRLDRDTSGVLMTARGAAAADAAAQFSSRETTKQYLAWCWGAPEVTKGRVDAPLRKQKGQDQDRESVVVDHADGQNAVSDYQVVMSGRVGGKKGPGTGPRVSLIVWTPLTGRTHQLRVHAQHLGHSIVGDPKYGQPPRLDKGLDDQAHIGALGLQLHAWQLHIAVQGKLHSFTAEPPEPMRELIAMLEQQSDDGAAETALIQNPSLLTSILGE